MKSIRIIFVLLLFLYIDIHVFGQKYMMPNNVSVIYNPMRTSLHPDYTVYRSSDSVAYLMFRVNLQELLFNQANPEGRFQAKLRIHYRLFRVSETSTMIDSSHIDYILLKSQGDDEFLSYIPFKMRAGSDYTLQILASDLLRRKSALAFVSINAKSEFTSNSYTLIDAETNTPKFTNWAKTGDLVRVRYFKKNTDKIFMQVYNKPYPLATPPFSTVMNELPHLMPDTVIENAYSDTTKYKMSQSGIYLFSIDTTKGQGALVLSTHKNFPAIKSLSDMIPPMEYLTTSKEYKDICKSKNKKIDVDNFWLKCTGSPERSKELVRIFYNRIQFANIYFTSLTEGWRTDRGMIYAVFGPPSVVYKVDAMERWIYGNVKEAKELSFDFVKMESRFSSNHFILQRSSTYTQAWRSAIESWRGGKPFIAEN